MITKIAYDYDLTITRDVGTFRNLITQSTGPLCEHYLITGRPIVHRERLIEDLNKNKIRPEMFKDIIMYPEDYTSDQFSDARIIDIGIWKAEKCRELGINLLFEDSVIIIDSIKKFSPFTLIALII